MLKGGGGLVRQVMLETVLLVAATGAAGAQVQAVFYHIPVSPGAPSVATAFSTTPYCTTNVGGSTSGFSFNFLTATTQNELAASCPGTTAADFFHNFAIRFTGSLVAPSTGNYNLTLNSDDGSQVFINGVTYYDNFIAQGSGPGTISALLNGGANPFTVNYFENSFGAAFITFQLPDQVTVTPPPPSSVPEPSSIALLGTGLLGLAPMLRRRTRQDC